MRSLVGAVRDAVRPPTVVVRPRPARPVDTLPVPYTGARSGGLLTRALLQPGSPDAQMRAMGSVGTLFQIVHLLSTTTAEVGWHLWRPSPTGKPEDRAEVTSHAALDLWAQPNPFMPRQEFVEVTQQHLDLTGEAWWVVAYGPGKTPLELWPVRPDRMAPVPHPTKYLAGYEYTGPDGETVPLGLDEVIFLRMPNPLDPYRGMGPVQSLLTVLDAQRYTAEWNRNFFLNSAEPGGIIEVEKRLGDNEFDEMTARWQEQHRGVGNAHRVAVIEQGHWVDRKYTHGDMQFAELQQVTRETIREAFGLHVQFLGGSDVGHSRAEAEAAEVIFARWKVKPRCGRIKGALNGEYLRLFGPTAAGLEFDHDNPVPPDQQADNENLTARAEAAKTLVEAGYDRAEVLAVVGLPDVAVAADPALTVAASPQQLSEMVSKLYLGVDKVLTWEEARGVLNRAGAALDLAVPAPPVPGAAATPAAAARLVLAADPLRHALEAAAPVGHPSPARPRAAGDPPDLPAGDLPDVTPLQGQWEAALAGLLAVWAPLRAAQKAALVSEVRRLAASGSLPDLAGLSVDTADTADALADAMVDVAAQAADRVVAEAADQGVTVTAKTPPQAHLADVAAVAAAALGSLLALSATAAAMRANGPAATADDVATAVQDALGALTDAAPEAWAGGALTGAQNAARVETLQDGPTGAVYSAETNDKNTCLAPSVEVTTMRGMVRADQVTTEDRLLTHSGCWTRPSRIVISEVDESVVELQLSSEHTLSLTADHPMLVLDGGCLEWRDAGELSTGTFVVHQSSLELAGELNVPDLGLRETPYCVPTGFQVGGLPLVDFESLGMPVASVRLDHQVGLHEEVDGPPAYPRLGDVFQVQPFKDESDGAFDAGFKPTRSVAPSRAEAAARGRWADTEVFGADLAFDDDGGAPADLRAVRAVRELAVPEQGATSSAGGCPPAGVDGAGPGTVVVPMGGADGHRELVGAMGTFLGDPAQRRADLGSDLRVSELASDRAIDAACAVSSDNLARAHLTEAAWTASGPPPLEGAASLTAGGPTVDNGCAVNAVGWRGRHQVSGVEVIAIRCVPYRGKVYDFTVPDDRTFWAEGVLVHNCDPCRSVNGTWLGNTDQMDQVLAAYPGGAYGGYVGCLGRERCRGTVVGVWREGADE